MKGRKSEKMMALSAMPLVLLVVVMSVLNNQTSNKNVVTTTAEHTEEESRYQTQALSERKEEPWKDTRFGYMCGTEYDEDKIPRRFGYVVEEDIEEREIPLQEEDFKQLKKGQYFHSGRKKSTIPMGIIDIVGWFDGQIIYAPRLTGTGDTDTSPYYRIDDNTYVILFFEENSSYFPLDHIEVWDAEGNKLRDIEID